MDIFEDGIFHHKCRNQTCDKVVIFDDEPWCFEHSPDEGSSERGYSAKAEAKLRKEVECPTCNNVGLISRFEAFDELCPDCRNISNNLV